MVGTAAEVTPIREVDDQLDRAARSRHPGDPGGVPRHGARAQRALGQWLELRGRRLRESRRTGVKQEVTSVPLSGPYLGEREEELVLEVLRSGRLSLGPTIDRFEELLAERVGAPYAAAVSSGTDGPAPALHLGRHRPGRRGDHVAVLLRRERELLPLRGRHARSSRTSTRARSTSTRPRSRPRSRERTKAIVAVDIYGYPCELDELRAIADRHGLALIEDSCEALGAEYRGRAARLAAAAPCVFAFYPNKQITTGEGGMVVTHSEEEWHLVRSLRNQGRPEPGGWLEHVRLGFNYRLSDIAAALGIGQLERLDEILVRRSRGGGPLHGAARVGRRARHSVRRRRRPSPLVVRLRRPLPGHRCARARRSPPSSGRGSATTATSRRSTCSRTCASASASRRDCARWPRTSARARSRCRSSRGSRPPRRSASPRFSPQPSETPAAPSQSTSVRSYSGASVPSGRFRLWPARGRRPGSPAATRPRRSARGA